MSVKATVEMRISLEEIPGVALVPYGTTGQTTVKSNGLNLSKTYDAASDPNGVRAGYTALALVAGVATINLAAVPGLGAIAVNMTGDAVRAIIFRAKSTNTHPIKVAIGAANGFTGFGADFALTLDPGRQAVLQANDDLVAAGCRTLDVTGDTTEVLEFMLVSGDN